MTAGLLLHTIAGRTATGYFEIRCPEIPFKPEFVAVSDPSRVEARCRELSARTDVFIGAAVRARRAGGRSAIERVHALWVDCDVAKGAHRLADFPFAPTLEIASGTPGNVHAWFRLSKPIPTAWAETALRRLVHHLGADPKVKDVARVMRPPETLNHKHTPPLPVEVVEYRDVSYSAAELVASIPDPDPPQPRPSAPRRLDDPSDLDRISVASYVGRLTGHYPDARGRVRCVLHKEGGEANPSMKVYPDTNTWYCWGCSDGGDIYQLGAMLWGMDRRTQFVELKRRLSEELGVGG